MIYVLPGEQMGILHGIFRIGLVAKKPARQALQMMLAPDHQDSVILGIACPNTTYSFIIGDQFTG